MTKIPIFDFGPL